MTIAQVAKKYNVTPDTLRYYEKAGLIPAVRRTAGGIRDYSESDCGWVEFIRCMRGAGVQVEALVKYVSLFQKGEATFEERRKILLEQREKLAARIAEMQRSLDRLDYKIENYDDLFKH